MSDIFSPSWYRVSELKPRLRKHGEVHRHEYRDTVWFVLQDHAGGRSHRFSPEAYNFIGLMMVNVAFKLYGMLLPNNMVMKRQLRMKPFVYWLNYILPTCSFAMSIPIHESCSDVFNVSNE